MSAPITTARLGSTRCVGCEKPLGDAPVTEVESDEQLRNRYGGFSGPYKARRVTRRWHTECLERFERANEEYRAQVAADNEQMLAAILAAAGGVA